MSTESKLCRVKAMLALGDELGTLRLVASFPRLPTEEKVLIQRAVAVLLSPGLYAEMGFRTDVCIQQALDAIRRLYKITVPTPDGPMFTFDSPHTTKRADGTVVGVTVPVDFPATLESGGLLYRFERQGYRVADGRPAGYYRADEGSELWLCDGQGYVAE